MKRIERKHLKENELAHQLESVRSYLEPRSNSLTKIALFVLVALVAVVVISLWRQRNASRGEEALAQAMVALNAQVVPTGVEGVEGLPAAAQVGATGTFATEEAKLNAAIPKLKTAADAYPDTDAGIQARYHLAGALAALGRHDEAIAAFDDVATRAGNNSLYGRMARLGKADAQARAGQLDAAIASWKAMTTEEAEELPTDAILMDLAKAYVQKGNTEEARKAFTEIVDKHPQSPYTAQAREELENL
ncbi:MAG TPA: tetratricopeptide repeat protein, partial [Gemmatimonadaceae bacterium]|nr:tetratricopeptide repeat protein [Gemmatimonadaceae bacterium]